MTEVFAHVDNPNYRALVLFDRMTRAQDWMRRNASPKAAISWAASTATFPSGAIVRVGGIHHERDVDRYVQGFEYQLIMLNGLFSDYVKLMLRIRCRSFGGIERRFVG